MGRQMSGQGILFKQMGIRHVNKYIHARIAFLPVTDRDIEINIGIYTIIGRNVRLKWSEYLSD